MTDGRRSETHRDFAIGDRVMTTDEVLVEYRGCSGLVVEVHAGEVKVALDQHNELVWWHPRFLMRAPERRISGNPRVAGCGDATCEGKDCGSVVCGLPLREGAVGVAEPPRCPEHGTPRDICPCPTEGARSNEAKKLVVCARCNDTHRVRAPEDSGCEWWMCTSCPTPCQECRAGGSGPFCERTPCACACHAKHLAHATPRSAEAKPICSTCNDTHKVPAASGNGTWMCTGCPVPCRSCGTYNGTGPFCKTTPCACACHADSFHYKDRRSDKAKITTEQARQFLAALDLCTTSEMREAFIVGAFERPRSSEAPNARHLVRDWTAYVIEYARMLVADTCWHGGTFAMVDYRNAIRNGLAELDAARVKEGDDRLESDQDRLVRLESAAGFVVRRAELATSESLRERIESLKAVLDEPARAGGSFTLAICALIDAAKKVPIARMRPDYTGLDCIACGSGPGSPCSDACWAARLERAIDGVEAGSRSPVGTPESHPTSCEAKAVELLKRWRARGFPMGGGDLWDDTIAFLDSKEGT